MTDEGLRPLSDSLPSRSRRRKEESGQLKCLDCGKEYELSKEQAAMSRDAGFPRPGYCSECGTWERWVEELERGPRPHADCIECGADYEVLTKQIVFGAWDKTGKPTPWACEVCRPVLLARANARHEEEEAARETARLAAIAPKRREWRQTSGIPSFFMDKDFSTFKEGRSTSIDTAYKRCMAYAKAFPLGGARGFPSMVLYAVPHALNPNGNGIGKTHLVCAIIHKILDNWQGEDIRRPAFFVTEPDMIDSIQATYSLNHEDQQFHESGSDIVRRLSVEPLLIIDDIGKVVRRDQRFVQEQLFKLINRRYDLGLPVIVTTNLVEDKLEHYVGHAIMDRLHEMAKFIKLSGESYRRRVK